MISLELFHLSKATKYNKKMGTRNEKLKSTPTFFPLSFFFFHVATLLNLMQNQCSHITIFFFKESLELLTLNFNPVIRNHEKMSLPSYISKGQNLGVIP